MRILELHASSFHAPWRREHEVMVWGFGSRVDVRTGPQPIAIGELLERLPGGWRPDVIVLGEDGPLLRVLGLEDAPLPTVLLALDHRGHLAWQAQLARVFDVVCVGRRDALPAFTGTPSQWCPPWAPDGLPEPAGERPHPVVVVGAPIAADHRGLLAELARRVSVRYAEGPSAALFGQTRIVIRHPTAGPLDARTLQAMACGALLIAERSSDGLLELFEDGRELVVTPRGDTRALVTATCRYLDDEVARAEIAERGRAAVRSRHLRSHRAEVVLARVAQRSERVLITSRNGAAARAYCQLGEHARLLPADSPYAVSPETYFSAAARLALAGEMLEPDRRAVFGRIALAAGDMPQAIRHLDWAVASGGVFEDHLLRIETLVRAGDVRRARAAAEGLRAAYPDDPSAAAALARLGPVATAGASRGSSSLHMARGALEQVTENVRQAGRAFLGMLISQSEPPRPVPAAPETGVRLDLGNGPPAPGAICVRSEPGDGVEVVASPGSLPFADAAFDFVSSRSQLSQVPDPRRVASEIARVLKPGGQAFVTVPFLENAASDGADYYRFTPDGLVVLFEGLQAVATGSTAGPGVMLAQLVRSYVESLPPSKARRVLGTVTDLAVAASLLPLHWLNQVLPARPDQDRFAPALFLVAEKQVRVCHL